MKVPNILAYEHNRETHDIGTEQYGYIREYARVIIGLRVEDSQKIRTNGGDVIPVVFGFSTESSFDDGTGQMTRPNTNRPQEINGILCVEGLTIVTSNIAERFGDLTITNNQYSPALASAAISSYLAFTKKSHLEN